MNSPTNIIDSDNKTEFIDNLNAFRQTEFFAGMSIEIIKLFAFLCKRQIYKPGDIIFQQGDDDGCSYYILTGRAKLVFKNDEKEYVIREYASETYLSILSLMSPIIKQFSLIALEDTVCIVMTREAFTKVVNQFPEIPMKMAKAIGQRVARSEKVAIAEFESQGSGDLKNILGISLL